MLVRLSPSADGGSLDPPASPHPTFSVIVIGVAGPAKWRRKSSTAALKPSTNAPGALPTLLSHLMTKAILFTAVGAYVGGTGPPPPPPWPAPPPGPAKNSTLGGPDLVKPVP